MTRKLILAVLALPLLLSALGCVVYEDGGYYHHHYWHDWR